MTKFIFFVFALYLVASSTSHAAQFREGSQLELRGAYAENLFAAGRMLDVDVTSSEDIFLAGGDIRFHGDTRQGLILAGGDVALAGARMRNFVGAGGTLRIDGSEVTQDLVAAGGEIDIGSASHVRGTATHRGGKIILAGKFDGDVDVRGNRLELAPSAVISGNLNHEVTSLEISPGARILGQAIAVAPQGRSGRAIAGAILAGFFLFLGFLLVAPILALIFPGILENGAAQIRVGAWRTLGRGAVVALLLPFAWFGLLMSGIGTPIALVLTPLLIFGGALSWSVAVYALGLRLARSQALTLGQRFRWTLLASLIALIVWGIPLVGPLLNLLAFLEGVGALYAETRDHLRGTPSQPMQYAA
jgi:cytoskeletal protein CcmA (bactofilin family)